MVFETNGLSHLALVCSDMKRTVDFYEGKLGFKLFKTIDLSRFGGQHFFFDIGNGGSIAFFWFPEAPVAIPGVTVYDRASGSPVTGIGGMNHVAIDVPEERIDEYRQRLVDLGIECTEVMNHDDSETGYTSENDEDVWLRSIYFYDPDGIRLEFACYTRAFTPEDVAHEPISLQDTLAEARG